MGWYRKVKTLQERRQYAIVDADEPKGRAGRATIPSSWDDICNSSMGNKCWKRYRKTRYK